MSDQVEKTTKAPWMVVREDGPSYQHIDVVSSVPFPGGGGGEAVCRMAGWGPMADADAALIASAPSLRAERDEWKRSADHALEQLGRMAAERVSAGAGGTEEGGMSSTNLESTPGPWRWLNADTLMGDHGHRPIVLTSDHSSRSTMLERREDGLLHPLDVDGPNARLIAAAPDLLAAVRRFLAMFGDCDAQGAILTIAEDGSTLTGCQALARAAIAKSEGKP